MLPTNLPPWESVCLAARRWMEDGCFDDLVHNLRALRRLTPGRADDPTAVILNGRTQQSSPESGTRAGDDGHKRRKGNKRHLALDTLGNLLALHITLANTPERIQVGNLADAVQASGGDIR